MIAMIDQDHSASSSPFQKKTLQRKNFKQLSLGDTNTVHTNTSVATLGTSLNSLSIEETSHAQMPSQNSLYLRRGLKKKLTLDAKPQQTTSKTEIRNNNVIIADPSDIDINDTNASTLIIQSNNSIQNNKLDSYSSSSSSSSTSSPSTNVTIEYQLQDLVQLGKIGQGNSGTVLKVLHVPTSKILSKKTIPIEQNNDIINNQLLRELTIMKGIKPHDNIISFYGAFIRHSVNNEIIILMEYMDCASLDKILNVFKSFMEKENVTNYRKTWFNNPLVLSKISFAVLNGLSYLYKNYKIIHRDIKPSNVLINSKGQIKICDFGVSKKLINSIADTFVGTSTYMSPERIQGNVYSTKGDVWSLGLMIIELVTGEFPLGGHDDTPDGILDLLQRIVNEPSPRLPTSFIENYSSHNIEDLKELVNFVNRCCVKEEKGRSSINELLVHDFIVRYNGPSNTASRNYEREFRHWCKKIKSKLKEDKQIKREINERAKLEQQRTAQKKSLNR
ncbi:hypothetical protein KAFR_0B00920 [Kazachstania africana CBS 2517]|uniref:mitogen-activated protein kinase kinase n=1 Tax=Kazachstania africana (strain ATCC 22294 / BCRC 22015 / CBS 2517 / CECT 1963 / NBRC 1671 / NRRL Y-8276) TaxID=1071382 RepID=H2APU0_KAZAF|nr:hypothetical protein KAFR_0B00920 [Kazachstania africana CBS 2517]CCF56390.1 hypothetical protein KAFR_0B00920 [Kazachstania africana CBS 2517]